jgi:tetratricopeptide (TPR) repeat protein
VIGTRYIGKSRSVECRGTCSECGAETTLVSYDAWLWAVVLFVPVIPLGKTVARVLRSTPAFVGLVLVGYALVAAGRGALREVWLLNGLDRPYRITLKGRSHTLAPGQPVRIRLGEGRSPMTGDGPLAALGEQQVEVATPFWSRPFASTAIVVNPDRTALLRRVRVRYGDQPSAHDDRRWLAGRLVTAVEDVDHAFEPPPSRLKMKKGATASRVVLHVAPLADLDDDEIESAVEALGRPALVALASSSLKLDPTSTVAYRLLARVASPEERLKLLEPGLAERPLVIERHRAFHEAMEALDRGAELETAYTMMLAREPSNGLLAYLAARAVRDPAARERKLRELAADPSAPAVVVDALAAALMTTGQVTEALEAARRYARLAPNAPDATQMLVWALLANGRADEALAELARARAAGSPTWSEELPLLGARGREKDAEKLFADVAKTARTSDEAGLLRALTEGLVAYGAGREVEAGQLLSVGGHPQLRLTAAVMKGELPAEAEKDENPATALAALGLKNPADRQKYFELARALNVLPTFPHLTVKAIVGP